MHNNDSFETLKNKLRSHIQPKIIIVNHEKRLGIDTTCSNLAIKYDMIYISAYQLIKQNITQNTPWGKKLMSTHRSKTIMLTTQVRDEFNELEYSPAHYDQDTVHDLIKETINEKHYNQKYVLLEGMCNSLKLKDEDEQLEIRLMDELMKIETKLGDIQGIIGLQFQYMNDEVKEGDMEWLEFNEKKKEEKKPVVDDDGNEVPAEEPVEEEEAKPKFRPEDHQWTVTDRIQKNLPQLYISMKGKSTAIHDMKPADFYSSSQYEAISKSLDEFCKKMSEKDENVYLQVIFSE